MFVRTVYATGDPTKIDAALRALNTAGRELLADRPGYRGAGVFVDRELGKLLSASWWASAADRHNSDEVMRVKRAALLEPFAGTVTVDNYEVAALHVLQHPRMGGGLRVTRLEFEPADADLLTDVFRASVLPRLEAARGVAGASLFVDRERGRGMVGMLFADRDALAASRSGHALARHRGVAKAHAAVTALEEFEVVHADVRPD